MVITKAELVRVGLEELAISIPNEVNNVPTYIIARLICKKLRMEHANDLCSLGQTGGCQQCAFDYDRPKILDMREMRLMLKELDIKIVRE